VYELLRSLESDRSSPKEAMARVGRMRSAPGLAELELVWERSAFDQSLHFDALLPVSAGTLSMSWCPDRGVPWPLRGVQRNSEADLIRVDGHTLRVGTAIALMDLVWNDDAIVTRLIDAAIIHKQQMILGIDLSDVTDDQLQRAMDEFRGRRNLLTPEHTERWFEEHGIDQQKLENILADKLVRSLVRDRTLAGDIAARLSDVSPFDRVALEWLGSEDADHAAAVFARVRDGTIALGDELRRAVAAGGPAPSPFVWLRRRDLPPALAAHVFDTPVGTLLAPFELAGTHRIARVLAVELTKPDDPDVLEQVREACFDEWLAERRRGAEIEWFWGFDKEIT
jgi:putative peptide maturation system protein